MTKLRLILCEANIFTRRKLLNTSTKYLSLAHGHTQIMYQLNNCVTTAHVLCKVQENFNLYLLQTIHKLTVSLFYTLYYISLLQPMYLANSNSINSNLIPGSSFIFQYIVYYKVVHIKEIKISTVELVKLESKIHNSDCIQRISNRTSIAQKIKQAGFYLQLASDLSIS